MIQRSFPFSPALLLLEKQLAFSVPLGFENYLVGGLYHRITALEGTFRVLSLFLEFIAIEYIPALFLPLPRFFIQFMIASSLLALQIEHPIGLPNATVCGFDDTLMSMGPIFLCFAVQYSN